MPVSTPSMEQCGAMFPYGHIHTCPIYPEITITDLNSQPQPAYPVYDPNADLITAIRALTNAIERLIKKSNGYKPE